MNGWITTSMVEKKWTDKFLAHLLASVLTNTLVLVMKLLQTITYPQMELLYRPAVRFFLIEQL